MVTGVLRKNPVQQRAGFHGRAAKAQRRQEKTTRGAVSYVFPIYIFTHSMANQQSNRPASDDETRSSGGHKTNWTIKDLPPDTDLNKWSVFIVARFIDHFVCYGEPWDANAYLEDAQALWKDAFPRSKHIPTQRGDAVYPLVCLFHFSSHSWIHFRYILVAPTHI